MSYVRPHIEALKGYTPGEQPRVDHLIKLNTNENPYPPSPRVFEALAKGITDRLRRYPDPIASAFREAASRVLGVPADWILACNGSDDALTIIARACLDAGEELVAPTPSYPLYEVLAGIQGCRCRTVPFTSHWRLPETFAKDARLAIVPNPNSPTGTWIRPSELGAIARSSEGLLVVDEAYGEFAPQDALELVRAHPNVAVTRTFSKAYGLAGIRFGFLVARPELVYMLSKVKDSYNTNHLSQLAATAAIEDQEYYREVRGRILATRARLESALTRMGFEVLPSHANFVWMRGRGPLQPIALALKERKILVRYLSYPGDGDGIRISIGTDAEIDLLLDGLRQIL